MYAIIKTGGKQYRIREGDRLQVEKLVAAPGDEIRIDEVLYVSDADGRAHVGAPYVAGASVTARILEQGRLDKILIVKFRRRKHYQRTAGHRQYSTRIEITRIQAQ
jgi:large subunit ribosomal protein L21